MNNRNITMRNDERKEDKPPYSRIFVVCSKNFQEEDLKEPFEKFGAIEDLYIPRDRNTGESKGVAYIKYHKTSSAAAAIQEMHMKIIGDTNKPLRVMVAYNKADSNETNESKYVRLFIKVHKQVEENEIREHFSTFGKLETVHIQRDKASNESKGFAYVKYSNFVDAAKAFEECDRKYRAVFATPKEELKRSRNSLESFMGLHSNNSGHADKEGFVLDYKSSQRVNNPTKWETLPLSANPKGYKVINVTCAPQVPQKHIEKLFNIIPGMTQFQYSVDLYNGICKAVVNYEEESQAAYALGRLNNYEFPSGEIISVKPFHNPLSKAASELTSIVNNFKCAMDSGTPDLLQLANAIAQASSLIKDAASGKLDGKMESQQLESYQGSGTIANYCSVVLPPTQPMVQGNTVVAQRCFIVCKPQPPPITVLRDIFCRFGDLIDASTFPNKTFGFVKYASVKSAQEAIKTLNGATVCGIYLKVLEADEKPLKDRDHKADMMNIASCIDHNDDSKRMRID